MRLSVLIETRTDEEGLSRTLASLGAEAIARGLATKKLDAEIWVAPTQKR